MDVNLSNKLANLIDNGTKRNPLPMVRGNSIRIGKVAVRYSKNKGYILFDCESSKQFYVAGSKIGALAVAKVYSVDNDITVVKDYDKEYSKHDNDCVFYEYTIKNSNNSMKRDLAQVRFEVSKSCRDIASQKLEAIIFD
jgi:hypothetical protein